MRSLSRNSWRLALLLLAVLILAQAPQARGQRETLSDQASWPEKRAEQDYSPFPNPDAGYVTDIANLLTLEEEEYIELLLWQTESRSGVEIIVVTINSIGDYPGTPNSSIEVFAKGLFDRYGIGNMPENNGVLLLVAVRDRKARIELGAGYGHTRDADARKIMDKEILPSFRQQDYAAGITKGVEAIMLEFAHIRAGLNWPLIIVAIAIPVVGVIAYSLFRNGKRGWGWVCVGFLIVLILALLYILRQTLQHMPRGRSSGWSSGGLGGFGGGFSGGGGATGSW
ncbi:MAG: TPM domain-containing protein [Candidatus Hydrogenedentota bacterium]|nr:MAG: TPM domain-containing protein [Candidatus Hydrogenedentota bacterium]